MVQCVVLYSDQKSGKIAALHVKMNFPKCFILPKKCEQNYCRACKIFRVGVPLDLLPCESSIWGSWQMCNSNSGQGFGEEGAALEVVTFCDHHRAVCPLPRMPAGSDRAVTIPIGHATTNLIF